MPKNEFDADLRHAATRIAKADDHELVAAIKHFLKVEVDWYNAIPRDRKMVPVTA